MPIGFPVSGGLTKIAEASGTGASGVIEFAAIPATFRALRLDVVARTTAATTATSVLMTFETSPTAGAYDFELLTAVGATVAAAENIGTSDYIEIGSATGTTGPANTPSICQIQIPEYAGTSLFKTLFVHGVAVVALASTNIYLRNFGGVFESTAAIDRIRLTLASGNWSTTSRVTLWGVMA